MSLGIIADSELRLWIYRHFAETGHAPSPAEAALHVGLTPDRAALHRLERDADALVLVPGTPYIWDGRAVLRPTSFLARSGSRQR